MRPRGAAALAAILVAAACLTACTAHRAGHGRPAAAQTSPTSPTSPSSPSCPASYRPPDPARPRVTLRLHVSADHATVIGSEHVVFVPDLAVSELVFRLTANTRPTVAAGNRIDVTSARSDRQGGAPTYAAADADPSTQGGLLRIPLKSPVPAGSPVTADIDFRVTLGAQSFDRLGRASAFAWFASAQPLLAWERGYGWHTEPLLRLTAESATSEAMQTDLTVTAPAADVVIMSGDPTAPTTAGGERTWRAQIEAARDVSVAVGPFVTTDQTVGAVRLRIGSFDAASRDQLVPLFRRALEQLAARFGPYPFPSLSVARLPSEGGGIEYPSSILMLNGGQVVGVHETAHQWFYAMVGNSQAQHAWLDEAFATYAEQLVDDDPTNPAVLKLTGPVDRPTASYGDNDGLYVRLTYGKGSAALHAARSAAGPSAFDAAIRCYVNANAWRIASPRDLETALGSLPGAVQVLRQAGALP